MRTHLSISEVVHGIYEASESSELWNSVIMQLCVALDATGGMVIALDQAERPLIYAQHGVEAGAQQEYEQHFRSKDVLLQRFRAVSDPLHGWVGLRHHLISDKELEATEYYTDFMRRIDQFHQIGATVGKVAQCSFGGVTMLRSKRAGAFLSEDIDFLKGITSHLRRAFLLHQKLDLLRGMNQASEKLGAMFVMLSQEGCVLSMTSSAEALIASGTWLSCKNGRIKAVSITEDAGLQSLLVVHDPASAPKKSGFLKSGANSLLLRGNGNSGLHVTVTRISRNSAFFPAGCVTCMILSTANEVPAPRGKVLRDLFGLSFTESRLADLLLSGQSVSEAGDTMSLTNNSVRFLTKVVFRKTGVNGQSGLIRLMMSLPGLQDDGLHK